MRFSRLVEQIGSVHHLIDVEAPWQNCRCERHGGVLKRALYKAFTEAKPENLEEIQLVLDSVVSAKNRYYNRDGYSPYQFVFGSSPRLPQSILSDDLSDLASLQDLFPHADEDRAAASFRRAHEVRQAGVRALMVWMRGVGCPQPRGLESARVLDSIQVSGCTCGGKPRRQALSFTVVGG